MFLHVLTGVIPADCEVIGPAIIIISLREPVVERGGVGCLLCLLLYGRAGGRGLRGFEQRKIRIVRGRLRCYKPRAAVNSNSGKEKALLLAFGNSFSKGIFIQAPLKAREQLFSVMSQEIPSVLLRSKGVLLAIAIARGGLTQGRGGGLLGGDPESRRHGLLLLRIHGLRLRNPKARVRRMAKVLGLAERLLGGTEGGAGRGRITVVPLRLRRGGETLLARVV